MLQAKSVGFVISALKISGLAAGAFFSLLSGAAAGEIVGIRFGKTSATETRVVLDAVGEISTLGAPVEAEQVIKIAFDRSTTVSIVPLAGRGDGLIDSYGFNSEGLELKFRSTSKIKSLFVIPPSASNARHRLVVDIERGAPTAAPVAAAALPAPKFDSLTDVIASVAPPTAAVAVTPSSAAPTLKPQPLASVAPPPAAKPVIVIDPGHGGTDPGASGPSGSKEANANLAAGLALAEVLEKTGRYTVVMTRHRDSRLAHEERSRIARSAKADLFISLHADAHTDSKVRGASVYTLSEEGSERSAREALAQGNYHVFDVDIGETDPEVGGILYNLAQRKTENESDRFAEILVDNLQTATLLLNNSHRRGNFKVLLAPDVPAVLLELAFISNKKDEANLGSEAWRTRTMTAVAGAIDAYFADRARALHAGNIPASPTR